MPRRDRDEDARQWDDEDRPRRARKKSSAVVWLIVGGVVILLGCIVAVPLGAWLLIPRLQERVEAVREQSGRQRDTNNLRIIGLGLHNYHDANGQLPPPYLSPPGQKDLPPSDSRLSWRVGILPYVEQDNLYRAMNLSEAWDAPVNRPFSDTPVSAFSDSMNPSNQTRYRAFVGRSTIFDPHERVRITTVTDGLSNTILVAEAAEAVPWAQFKELPFDASGPLPALGRPNEQSYLVLMGDGSTRVIRKSINPTTLRAAITRNGGELVTLD